jgi:hypothetical protein
MHQVRALEHCPETFDQSTSGLIVQDDADQDAIGAPLDPLGRAVQLVGPCPAPSEAVKPGTRSVCSLR